MVASYNSLPTDVVARALDWLDCKELGRLSPCGHASDTLASAAFEGLAKRRFGALRFLGRPGPAKDWRQLLKKHIYLTEGALAHTRSGQVRSHMLLLCPLLIIP